MKIATRLKLAALVPVLMALVISVALFVSQRAVQALPEKHGVVRRILTGVNQLNGQLTQYLLYHEDRPVQQFLKEQGSLEGIIPTVRFSDKDQQARLDNILRGIESMKSSFLRLVENHKRAASAESSELFKEVENRLAGRLLVQSGDVLAEASYLKRMLDEDLASTQRRINVLIFVLIVATTFFLTFVLIGLTKNIVASLRTLSTGMEAVGSGDLGHRIGLSSQDEIGELARSFDRMTEHLQAVTVSRNELERRVRERTAELERRNKELADFTFVASHDLQEPLRKIQTFGDLLIRKYGTALNDEGRYHVDRMRRSAARMQSLLKSLLDYSRVTTKEKPFNTIDLGRAVKESLLDLELVMQEKGAQVEVNGLPTVEADPFQMTQLFQNLIGNAVKFHRGAEPPQVKIYSHVLDPGGSARGKAYEVFVEDNGIGFEEDKYLEKIFAPFERLHGRDEFEGVGMGLAICKKIVERHGGGITAKSKPGKGSTFIVTLPEKQSAGSEA